MTVPGNITRRIQLIRKCKVKCSAPRLLISLTIKDWQKLSQWFSYDITPPRKIYRFIWYSYHHFKNPWRYVKYIQLPYHIIKNYYISPYVVNLRSIISYSYCRLFNDDLFMSTLNWLSASFWVMETPIENNVWKSIQLPISV